MQYLNKYVFILYVPFRIRNFKLLSFGTEAEEDEEEAEVANKEFAGKSKSTYDLLDDAKPTPAVVTQAAKTESDEDDDSEDSEEVRVEELKNIRNKLKPNKKKFSSNYYLNKDEKEARKRKA